LPEREETEGEVCMLPCEPLCLCMLAYGDCCSMAWLGECL